MIKYKLTSQKLTTFNGFQWEIGKKVITSGKGELCGPGFLHYYHDPLLAVLLNTLHARIENPRLFTVLAEGVHKDDLGLKGGCTEMTLLEEIALPTITTIQRIAFGILTARAVYKEPIWNAWAESWLSGRERSVEAARRAARAAWEATGTARAARAAEVAAEAAAEDAAKIDLITIAEEATKY